MPPLLRSYNQRSVVERQRESLREMDGRGGCCIARYNTGCGGASYDTSKVDRIMLRFRPIAPKPAAGGPAFCSSTAEKGHTSVKSGRGKRRYVRDGNNNGKRNGKKKKSSSPSPSPSPSPSSESDLHGGRSGSDGETVVTLPLLPETPDRKESPARGSSSESSDLSGPNNQARNTPIWLNFNSNQPSNTHVISVGRHVSVTPDQAVVKAPQPVRLLGSIVTVECVKDTWDNEHGLGRTEEDRARCLDQDTCPGFVSDRFGRVIWTNGAYREMVGHDLEECLGGDVMVWLVMKERVPITCSGAFTCKVRLQYACGKERGSLTAPCDAWIMDGGGFAWRLDVKAALCLGR